MSDALAVSMPQPAPSVGRSWVKANVLAALINAALGLAALLLVQTLGVTKPDAGTVSKVIAFVTYFVAGGAGLAIFATLNGRVLREKLPAFPLRTWITLHTAAGLLLGIFAGFGALQPPTDVSELTRAWPAAYMIAFVFGGAIGGAIAGVIAGSFQALIMHKAAHGLGAWIGFSILAGVLAMMVYTLLIIMGVPLTTMTGEIIARALAIVMAAVAAFTMVPAVSRLTPRHETV
jgi:hypothetical protein